MLHSENKKSEQHHLNSRLNISQIAPFIIFVKPITSVMGLTNEPTAMNIDDLLAKLARGQQALRDPAVWQQRGEDLFPDTAFTITVDDGKVKTTGLSPEQQRLLQQEIVKLLGL